MEAFLEEFQHLRIQLEEIKSATDNFDDSRVIGKGGFGMVYEGVLCHSKGQSIVAFKRLGSNCGQGDSEFLKEILMLSRHTHENLISLLGFCDEDGEKILVYEHASHGSLDRYLGTTTLTWRQRLKICLEAATGLCYLHHPKGTRERVIHRDIKSSNILLDEDWIAKISDLGLSKIGPANQQHTFLATNIAGTPGYIDPLYMETYSLTKESDVYSFGVVLFEVLCGRLCFEYNHGRFKSLVTTWKQSFEEKTFDEIIFQDLKQQMDPRSLETFSNIAYRCLQKSRKERPKMSQIVETLENALRFQENFEKGEPPMDYEEMCKTTVPPLVYRSKENLMMLLTKGVFINGGKTWFWLNKKGEHCEMISAAECLIPINYASSTFPFYRRKKSRFAVEYYCKIFCWKFKTRVTAQFLSPNITYTVNLVFKFENKSKDYLGLKYILVGETNPSTRYIAEKREDGWLMAELYQFISDTRNVDLEISFECGYPLAIEGIEFLPLEIVEHEVEALEDEEVDMQTDTYWEQKLPTNYKKIIKWSKDSLQWTTKKELYSIMCKGFPIDKGEEWFFLAKNGKTCLMFSAKRVLTNSGWRWQSLPRSRFGKVAFDPDGSFGINFGSYDLSPQTTYACYLVYKLQENHSGLEPPVKVSKRVYIGREHSWYIYLVSPQTPIIRRKFYQATHNPSNTPKMKGLPRQRNDGRMEVQITEFQTGTTDKWIWENFKLNHPDNKSFKGLIVQGILLKPI